LGHWVSLFTRYSGNPILTRKQSPYTINSVFNAGATRLADGDTLLLCRVEERTGLSHLCAARSSNGIDGWRIDPTPTLISNPQDYPEEIWGIEDPRITYVPELQQYAIAYTSFARGGPGVSLAMTKDFKVFKRYGVIMTPEDKDAALLPRKIGGCWALIHRPVTPLGAHMWISYSPDLRHWGSHKVMLAARRGGWWDANKIGLCSPPIETGEGLAGALSRCPAASIAWALLFSTLTNQMFACNRATPGCSVLGLRTNEKGMAITSYFHVDKPSGPMEIRFISTTERRMSVWRWQQEVSAHFFRGSTPIVVQVAKPGCSAIVLQHNRKRYPPQTHPVDSRVI
jgi:hypothetical protein